jgi:hypothetical protein
MTCGLILAGGGIRVAWQAGAVQALHEHGLRFQHGDGTSGGLFTLGMLMSGVRPDELGDRWRSLHVTGFVSALPLRQYLRSPTDWPAFASAAGVEHRVLPHLGIDVGMIRAAAGMSGTFNVADFARKRCVAIPHTDIDLPRLLAGVSLAGLMPAVEAHGSTWTDAVWIQDANLMEAVRRGCTELWVLWCIANTPSWGRGALEQYVHMIELSANGALFGELDRIAELNERRRRGEAVFGSTTPVTVHVVKPALPLPLDPDFVAGRIDAETLVAQGYRDACRYLDAQPADGVGLDETATATAERPLGLRLVLRADGQLADVAGDPRSPHSGPASCCLVIEADDLAAMRHDAGAGTPAVGALRHPHAGYRPFRSATARLCSAGGERRLVVDARLSIDGCGHAFSATLSLPTRPARWSAARQQHWSLHADSGQLLASGGGRQSARQVVRSVLSAEPTGAHDLTDRLRAVRLGASVLTRRPAGAVRPSGRG